jgi:hypothetical protein
MLSTNQHPPLLLPYFPCSATQPSRQNRLILVTRREVCLSIRPRRRTTLVTLSSSLQSATIHGDPWVEVLSTVAPLLCRIVRVMSRQWNADHCGFTGFCTLSRLHIQGPRVSTRSSLLFDAKDGRLMCLRNIGWLSPEYTALYPRR